MTGSRRIASLGLSVEPPAGWEATIYRRNPDPGERTYPVMHAATVPLPPERGDYGAGVVELLGATDVVVGILEFGSEAAGTSLFKSLPSVPGLVPNSFQPRQLQRTIRGQAGAQRFFAVQGRAFCLYAVVGSLANRIALSSRANQLIGSFRVEASAG